MTLSYLPWQAEHWQRIVSARETGRLPHALLLSGATGLGKHRFATALARALLCQTPLSDLSACGHCRDCRLLAAGNHPDWLNCHPSDSNTVIKIDQIRELAEFTTRTSQTSRARIAMVAPADRLNVYAANALLKTLEEPPLGVLIILLSTRPRQMPATLRSRCHKLTFAIPPTELAKSWLIEQMQTQNDIEQDLVALLKLARGAPLLALEFAKTQSLANRRALFDIYQAVIQQQLSETAAAEQWLRYDVSLSLDWLQGWHLDIARLKLGWPETTLDHPDLVQDLRQLADLVPVVNCFQRYDATLQMRLALNGQRNIQMLLEAFFGACQSA